MIIIKIDETKTEDIVDLPVSIPDSCFKCPFYYAQDIEDGCEDVGWCSLNRDLGYSWTNYKGETYDGDGNLIDDVVRPVECPLISITKEEKPE